MPIFDAGRKQTGLDSAQVTRAIAVAQYEKTIQIAFREVSDALASRAALGEQLRAQQAQAFAEGVRYKLSDLRYQNGLAIATDSRFNISSALRRSAQRRACPQGRA